MFLARKRLSRLRNRFKKIQPKRFPKLEALEPRVLLSGDSPFTLASYTPLVGKPPVVAGPGGLGSTPLVDLNGDNLGDTIVHYENGDGFGTSSLAFVTTLHTNADGSTSEYRIAKYNVPVLTSFSVIEQVLTADLNHDSRLDVIVKRNEGGVLGGNNRHVDIFLGQADGSFTEPVPTIDLAAALTAPELTIFDMNGDGQFDLFLREGVKFTVYRGNGDGTFLAPMVTTPSIFQTT